MKEDSVSINSDQGSSALITTTALYVNIMLSKQKSALLFCFCIYRSSRLFLLGGYSHMRGDPSDYQNDDYDPN